MTEISDDMIMSSKPEPRRRRKNRYPTDAQIAATFRRRWFRDIPIAGTALAILVVGVIVGYFLMMSAL